MDQSIPNFEKLEKDVLKAIEDDVRYKLRNDAKFRAVDQRVPTYDDFKDMVDAAHLKPIQKGETFRVTPKDVWNSAAREKNKLIKIETQSPNDDVDVFVIPSTSIQFNRTLKQLHSHRRFDYLLHIGCEQIAKLHQLELGYEMMGEIICILRDHVTENANLAVDLLELMSKCKRFSLDLKLLSNLERLACKELFKKLQLLSIDNLKILENKYLVI